MNASDIATETGIPVGQQPAGPIQSPPVDPAAAAAAAGGQQAAAPAAAEDPMAGAAPPQESMSVEEMASQGDPLASFLLKLDKKLDLQMQMLMSIIDKMQVQVPASQSFQTQLKEIDSQKSASMPTSDSNDFTVEGLLDTDDPDDVEVVTKEAALPSPSQSLGVAAKPITVQHNKFITNKRTITANMLIGNKKQ